MGIAFGAVPGAYEEDKAQEHQDSCHLWQDVHNPLDQQRHARHPLERAQRAQRAEGAEDGVVAKGGEDDGEPCEGDHHEIELSTQREAAARGGQDGGGPSGGGQNDGGQDGGGQSGSGQDGGGQSDGGQHGQWVGWPMGRGSKRERRESERARAGASGRAMHSPIAWRSEWPPQAAYLAPRVVEIGPLLHQEPISSDFEYELHGEDSEEDPLANRNKLGCGKRARDNGDPNQRP